MAYNSILHQALIVIILTFLLLYKASAVILDYPYRCPTDCECATLGEHTLDKIQVHCQVLKIHPDLNFNVIQTNHTAVLFLICNEIFNSQLFPDMLSHLSELEELGFLSCPLKELFPEALRGLEQLRMLNITPTLYEDNVLKIQPNSFIYTPNLELMDFNHLKIPKFPAGVFCGLEHLRHLNVSYNMIENEYQLGYINDSFIGVCVPELTVLDLRGNELISVTLSLVDYMPNLEELYLSNNKLKVLEANVFANLSILRYLDLSYNYLTSIHSDQFEGMVAVKSILLHHNHIECIPKDTFKDNVQLKLLRLQNNLITSDCLPHLYHLNDLEEIDLSYNHITHIQNSTFDGLLKLTTLNVAVNQLSIVEPGMFYTNPFLQFLNVSSNSLTSFIFDDTYTMHVMTHLKHLDLSMNKLSDLSIESARFNTTPNLEYLYLSHNNLSTIPIQNSNLTKLVWLDVNFNNITTVETDQFYYFPNLLYLLLRGNQIDYVPKRGFKSLPNLQGLDLSYNEIQVLEYQAFNDLPHLLLINLQHNKISEVNLVFNFIQNLQILKLDYNNIRKIQTEDFPPTLNTLTLSNNNIKFFSGYFLTYFPQLQVIDLSNNKAREISSLFLKFHVFSVRPYIFLAGNYLICNCNMVYLLDVNEATSHYARVVDLDHLLCETFHPAKQFNFLTSVKRENFLCRYADTGVCPTEDFDPCSCCRGSVTTECSCRQFCPDNCECYHNLNQVHNPILCSNKNLTYIPDKLPQPASALFLDGNEISVLGMGNFLYNNKATELYLNNSNIQEIIPGSFNGLTSLEMLYLQNNNISHLKNNSFEVLHKLQSLFLQNNDIDIIETGAFNGLTSLKTLNLQSNRLMSIKLAALNGVINSLEHLYIAQNNWLCDCVYGPELQNWTVTHSFKLEDQPSCGILDNPVKANSSLHYVSWVDFDQCKNITTRQVIVNKHSKAFIPVTSTMLGIFLITIIACFVIYRYIDLIQVWLYSRYGVRLHQIKDDEDKDYDAFISYSSHDERFVVRELAPTLEEGDPPYRLCVHYRDWMIGRGIAESIIHSVQSSKRTLLLLSNNYISSEWCNYEFRTAHHQMLKDKTCHVIVVLMEDTPPENLDDEMKLYIKSHTYIKLSDPWFWKRLKYALPSVPKEEKQGRWEAKEREKEMLRQTREAMNRLGIKGP